MAYQYCCVANCFSSATPRQAAEDLQAFLQKQTQILDHLETTRTKIQEIGDLGEEGFTKVARILMRRCASFAQALNSPDKSHQLIDELQKLTHSQVLFVSMCYIRSKQMLDEWSALTAEYIIKYYETQKLDEPLNALYSNERFRNQVSNVANNHHGPWKTLVASIASMPETNTPDTTIPETRILETSMSNLPGKCCTGDSSAACHNNEKRSGSDEADHPNRQNAAKRPRLEPPGDHAVEVPSELATATANGRDTVPTHIFAMARKSVLPLYFSSADVFAMSMADNWADWERSFSCYGRVRRGMSSHEIVITLPDKRKMDALNDPRWKAELRCRYEMVLTVSGEFGEDMMKQIFAVGDRPTPSISQL